jgi:hypothetical protein
MHKIIAIIISSVVLCSCNVHTDSDTEKIAALEKLCRESASEDVIKESADGGAILGSVISSSSPIGSANLPVLDLEYSPDFLLKALFSGRNPMKEVIFSKGRSGTDTVDTPRVCQSHHYVLVRNSDESDATFLGKCDPTRIVESVNDVRYAIIIEYGKLSNSDIRSFTLKVNDRTNGRILAEQKSYQLLMGGMKSNELRILHGWGSSQGVRTCKLTPPDQLIKKVFH